MPLYTFHPSTHDRSPPPDVQADVFDDLHAIRLAHRLMAAFPEAATMAVTQHGRAVAHLAGPAAHDSAHENRDAIAASRGLIDDALDLLKTTEVRS